MRVDNGDCLSDAHPLDIASLLKQFLRELPEPLLTTSLHDVFVHCVRDNSAIADAVLLTCLLLPTYNLAALRYVALFLSRVAASSSVNRMDAANLAVCLAPNFLYSDNSKTTSVVDSTVLMAETAVIRVVVEHAASIGIVSNSLMQRALLLSACFSSDIEEQNASTCIGIAGTKVAKRKKKKKRSGSLQGMLSVY